MVTLRKIIRLFGILVTLGAGILFLSSCTAISSGKPPAQSPPYETTGASSISTPSPLQFTLRPLLTPSEVSSAPPKAKITPTFTPIPELSATLPPQARIGLRGKSQSLPLSCEARSATDWAAYFGIEIDELEFQHRLPLSDNPEEGFVGNADGVWGLLPPRSYGVHAPPVAALLREYGLAAQARRKMTLEELKQEIASGRPVIVWVTGHVQAGTPSIYTSRTGRKVRVAAREHTVIVTGYTPETIIVVDGALTYGRATQNFLESWNVLENMAIVFQE